VVEAVAVVMRARTIPEETVAVALSHNTISLSIQAM
jgi:hypothetical protein